jgi:hypothetical protein
MEKWYLEAHSPIVEIVGNFQVEGLKLLCTK